MCESLRGGRQYLSSSTSSLSPLSSLALSRSLRLRLRPLVHLVVCFVVLVVLPASVSAVSLPAEGFGVSGVDRDVYGSVYGDGVTGQGQSQNQVEGGHDGEDGEEGYGDGLINGHNDEHGGEHDNTQVDHDTNSVNSDTANSIAGSSFAATDARAILPRVYSDLGPDDVLIAFEWDEEEKEELDGDGMHSWLGDDGEELGAGIDDSAAPAKKRTKVRHFTLVEKAIPSELAGQVDQAGQADIAGIAVVDDEDSAGDGDVRTFYSGTLDLDDEILQRPSPHHDVNYHHGDGDGRSNAVFTRIAIRHSRTETICRLFTRLPDGKLRVSGGPGADRKDNKDENDGMLLRPNEPLVGRLEGVTTVICVALGR